MQFGMDISRYKKHYILLENYIGTILSFVNYAGTMMTNDTPIIHTILQITVLCY